jgi:hypothetical protein
MKVRILVLVTLILIGVVATQYVFSLDSSLEPSLDLSAGYVGAAAWCFLYDDGSGFADASASWYTLLIGEYSLSCSVSGEDTQDSASQTGSAVGTNSIYIQAELPSDALSAYAYSHISGTDVGGVYHVDLDYDFCDQPD